MYKVFFKRVLDFIISLIALVILSPVLLVLTVAGAVAMRGNPFFLQKRPGKINPKTGKEKIFTLIKFRTMDNRRDKNGKLLPDEVRLNKYGRFIRSTSLDELPQFINVLFGSESLIGPRPLLVEYLPLYNEEQRHRHDVRPGITGYAQSHGRNSISWQEKFKMDVWYTRNVSFRVDFSIFFGTIRAIVKREGISSETSSTMEPFTGNEELAK